MSNISQPGRTYLNIQQQQNVISQLNFVEETLPWQETLFFKHGQYINSVVLLGSAYVFWRAGFRGFYLFRYGRGRTMTLAFSLISSIHGGMLHHMFVRTELFQPYSSEDPFYYSRRSALSHMAGVFVTFSTAIALTYCYSLRSALIPHMNSVYPEETKFKTLRYMSERLRPFYKSFATTTVITTLAMAYVGYKALVQRQDLLARRLDRKTISHVEDSQNKDDKSR